MPEMRPVFGDFGEGGTGIAITAANDADGATATVPPGLYVLTVSGEDVEIKNGATVAAGAGTPLLKGTQWEGVRYRSPTAIACRSLGGGGVVKFTRDSAGD
jgi:hypothetical protein